MSAHHELAVVVGVDGSPQGRAALEWAVDDARQRGLGLHILHARCTGGWWPPAGVIPDELSDAGGRLLRDHVRRAQALAPGLPVSTEYAGSGAAEALVRLSDRADTVVVGARGLGHLRGAVLGSVSAQVTTHARCPVVVVREPSVHRRGTVLVGVDGAASGAAAEYAFMQAAARGAPLTALHAWWLDPVGGLEGFVPTEELRASFLLEADDEVCAVLAPWREKYPDVPVRHEIVRAVPAEALVERSTDAALLVVGSRGRGGFSGLLLGSVSRRVLHQAHCPVTVVHS